MSYSQNCIDVLRDSLDKFDEQLIEIDKERERICEARRNIEISLESLQGSKPIGKYTNLTNKDAIIEFLREQNRPCTITEITNALEKGGIKSKAGRFYSNVNAILIDKDNTNIFKKENKLWSLK